MKNSIFLFRSLALLIALTVALSPQALALRPSQVVNSAGLEEGLTQALTKSATGLEEQIDPEVRDLPSFPSAASLARRSAMVFDEARACAM